MYYHLNSLLLFVSKPSVIFICLPSQPCISFLFNFELSGVIFLTGEMLVVSREHRDLKLLTWVHLIPSISPSALEKHALTSPLVPRLVSQTWLQSFQMTWRSVRIYDCCLRHGISGLWRYYGRSPQLSTGRMQTNKTKNGTNAVNICSIGLGTR